MSEKLCAAVYNWLKQSGIRVSRRYLDQQLQSHPDYPSLASITDTLDDLGVDNMSLVVDKEKMDELSAPFLAHSPVNGGSFIVINDMLRQIKQNKNFERDWDGIVVLAEKPDNWKHEENETTLAKEKKVKGYTFFGIAAIVISAILSLSEILNFQTAGLLLTVLAGIAITVLIVREELGISNEITEHLCRSAGMETDCNAVISSKGTKLAGWFSWSDAGIIYFASFLLLLVVSPDIPLFSLFSASAIPFVFFSIYYQWQVVKKWCILCLLTVAILIIQFFLLLPFLFQFNSNMFFSSAFTVAGFIFLTIATTWLLAVKPVLQKNKELGAKNFSILRFKNNPDVFNALLMQQRKIDTASFEDDLQIGNSGAAIQIIVACNPYCGPCAKTHKDLHELIEKNDMGLTVRFSVKADKKGDGKTEIVEYLLQLLIDKSVAYKKQVLSDWYITMNMEKFKQQYLLDDKRDMIVLLRQQEQWTEKAKITATPTIFINGYELPKQYRAADLKRIIRSTGRIAETHEAVVAKINDILI